MGTREPSASEMRLSFQTSSAPLPWLGHAEHNNSVRRALLVCCPCRAGSCGEGRLEQAVRGSARLVESCLFPVLLMLT